MLLTTYFQQFVSNVEPSDERVGAVSNGHNTLRDHLLGDAELKNSIADSFLSGSYARHTAIGPIKDADIILVLGEKVVSADRRSPAPRGVLEDLRNAIDDFYDQVNLETQRRSIQIFLPEDDIRMDVVPAIAPNGKEKQLFVPDYKQGEWIPSHPYAHLTFASELNAEAGGRFVRIAKALKWWKSERLRETQAPKSFLFETLIAHNMDTSATSLPEALERTLRNIVDAYRGHRDRRALPKIADPGLPSNDLAASCSWTVDDFVYFYDQIASLYDLAKRANDPATDRDETIRLWQSVFGKAYPSTMTEEQVARAETASIVPVPPPRRALPYRVEISANLAGEKNKPARERYPSDGRKLPKRWWLRFRIDQIDVPPPYDMRWRVHNHGREAREAGGLYHEAFGGHEHWESTLYRGHHFMDCEIWKDGSVVAKTRHKVNIA